MKSFRIAPFAPLCTLLVLAAGAALPAQDEAPPKPKPIQAVPSDVGHAAVGQATAAAIPQALPPAAIEPRLGVGWHGSVLRFVLEADSKFLGGVIVSLRPELRQHYQGLPPLLGDFAVLGVGMGDRKLLLEVPQDRVPVGLKLYAQGVIADGEGIRATAVARFGQAPADLTRK